ncbi:MAG TPA: acetyl-CoA carboxylase biotin carboxyl carrier protein, partial [Candidatus Binataceae bacterium]
KSAVDGPLPDSGELMEIRDIKALLALMNEHGLSELEIEDKKGKVRLVRAATHDANAGAGSHTSAMQPSGNPLAQIIKGRGRVKIQGDTQAQADQAPELGPNQKIIESPMVGTFYRASSPEAAPFVEEGTSVRKSQPLCIIEAMKMMNEIEAPAAGRIVRVMCENGQPVQYGQPLMIIEVG